VTPRTPRGGEGLLRSVDEFRVDRVHELAVHLPCGMLDDEQDCDGDGEPGDRIGPAPAERRATRVGQHNERGEPVGARVQTVRDECGGADPASDVDAVPRDELVAEEAGQPAAATQGRWATSAGCSSRPIASNAANPADAATTSTMAIPGEAVAVGDAAVRRTPAARERHPQRYRGKGVGDVV
jgi:hypothetical protein